MSKKFPSGPSGANKLPRVTLRATEEEFEAWQRAADKAGMNLNAWIRAACDSFPGVKLGKAKKRP